MVGRIPEELRVSLVSANVVNAFGRGDTTIKLAVVAARVSEEEPESVLPPLVRVAARVSARLLSTIGTLTLSALTSINQSATATLSTRSLRRRRHISDART
jgi:hypothetical protein